MLYAPPCLNPTKSSGNCVARDVARGYDATDLAGEGRGRQDGVGGIFFALFRERVEAAAAQPPLLEQNQIERTPRCP